MKSTIPSIAVPLPRINTQLLGGFRVFNRRYLRKHFHAIAASNVARCTDQISASDSMVIYANHASWWDPLLAIYLAEALFPQHGMYAPIDAEAFEKYRIFGKMGFYPIDKASLAGARNFLSVSKAILAKPGTSIWITPEGQFADPRDHSASLMPGLAHLGHSLCSSSDPTQAANPQQRVWFLPVALEYPFWEERMPEVLARFGEPIAVDRAQDSGLENKGDWSRELESRLRNTQLQLAQLSMARQSEDFQLLLRSKSGTFFLYDWWRMVTAKISGKPTNTEHSDKF